MSAPAPVPAPASAPVVLRRSARVKAQLGKTEGLALNTQGKKRKFEGYTLSVKPSHKLKNVYIQQEILQPIDEKRLVEFFKDYLSTIYENIDGDNGYLEMIIGKKNMKGFSERILAEDGYDRVFESKRLETITRNIARYGELFTQFSVFGDTEKKGSGRLNGSTKLNLLISYIGKAVIHLTTGKSVEELKAFYRKIVVVLELAVEPKVFKHFFMNAGMKVKHAEIYGRSQEYLGIYETWSEYKNYDAGIRKFVVNYVRRAVLYMRKYDKTYDFGYELPYNYSHELSKALKFPLPLNGVYQYGPGPQYYEVSKLDWDFIPNVLLEPGCCDENIKHLNIPPGDWHNPPTKLWRETAVKLFENTEWWKATPEKIKEITEKIAKEEGRHDMNYSRLLLTGIPDKDQYNTTVKNIWNAEYPQYVHLFKPEGSGPSKKQKAKTGGILKPKPKAVAKPKPKVAKPKAKKQ